MKELVRRIQTTPRWMNADLTEEMRVEAQVSREGMAVLLLQQDPQHPRKWVPVSSWGRALEPLERLESRVVLELRALREGCWKLGEFTAFARKLEMRVSPELRALLKVAPRAHPELHA